MISLSKINIGEDEVSAAAEVLKSGWLVQGKNVKLFEEQIAKKLDVKHVIAVSSGTAALHLSLLAFGVSNGDEIIVPDFTFPATANAVTISGAKPVFVDIDISTYNIDVTGLEKKITDKTKGIIPVHQFGLPANMTEIKKIAEARSLFVIEDAACALGAKIKNEYCGTVGNVGCFSFHPRKVITTGEGGAVATNDDEVAEKIRILRNHGIKKSEEKTDFIYSGLNYRMTDFQAAIGLEQMKKLDSFIAGRQTAAHLYFEKLKNADFISLPYQDSETTHIFQTFHILLNDGIDRNKALKALREHGIETNYGANALSLLTSFAAYVNGEVFPNSQKAHKQGLALPLYPSLRKEEIEFVCEKLLNVLSEARK